MATHLDNKVYPVYITMMYPRGQVNRLSDSMATTSW